MKIDRTDSKHMTIRRSFNYIQLDFAERGVVLRGFLDRKALKILSEYPREQYRGILRVAEEAQKARFFNGIKIDRANEVKDLNERDFSAMANECKFLGSLVEDGSTLDLSRLHFKWAKYVQDNPGVFERLPNQIAGDDFLIVGGRETEVVRAEVRQSYLTNDLLFNPSAPYPESSIQYRNMIRAITSGSGIFPGDSDAPPPGYIVSPNRKNTHSLSRKGKVFTAQFFNPQDHAAGWKNRLIFTQDLITQMSTFGAYGLRGCSYDRKSYLERRYFASDRVGVILYEGMPVSFGAVTQYETMLEGKPLKYIFIHVVMTINGVKGLSFQRMGLTSYLIREIVSSMFWRNVWENEKKNLHLDGDGRLVNDRWSMWVAAHSGRASVFHTFTNSFKMAPREMKYPDAVRSEIIKSADQKIAGERGGRPLYAVRGDVFRDEAVYPEHNRYPIGPDGRVIFPDSERELSTFPEFLRCMGGEDGPKRGDALYMVGELTWGKIRAAKKREKMREGGGWFEQGVDGLRGRIVSHLQ